MLETLLILMYKIVDGQEMRDDEISLEDLWSLGTKAYT